MNYIFINNEIFKYFVLYYVTVSFFLPIVPNIYFISTSSTLQEIRNHFISDVQTFQINYVLFKNTHIFILCYTYTYIVYVNIIHIVIYIYIIFGRLYA